MRERRSEVRLMCADMVEVCWKEGPRFRRSLGLLEDISPSGACLQMETAIPLDAPIRWGPPQSSFSGLVRYCVYREIGYFVGVEFEAASQWSRKSYRPQHLLDPQKLLARSRTRADS
jgi:hypothetical protein